MRAIIRMLNPFASLWSRQPRGTARKHRRPGQTRSSHPSIDPKKVASLEKLVVEEIEVGGVAGPPLAIPKRRPKKPRLWSSSVKLYVTWIGLWLLPVVASLLARSAWPVDETRTLAVAWETWLHGDPFVPYLNGAPYPEQPPLLFWLIDAGWQAFGVSDWWPRLLPALFGLGALSLLGALARSLWPGQVNVARYAPVLLLAMVCWTVYLTLALPEMLTVFFVLLAALAIARLAAGQRRRGWLLLGVALATGTLASGPAIMIYVLPLVLLAPFWVNGLAGYGWGSWYADVAKALVVGGAIVLVCLYLLLGGGAMAYLGGLLAMPVPASPLALFSSNQPWWWYLVLLPVVSLPWSVFPLVWMRLWYTRRQRTDTGVAFCLFWAWPAIALLSLLDVKQPQFLLPLMPAFALGIAYLLFHDELVDHGADRILSSMGFPIIVIGALLAVTPGLPRVPALPPVLWEQRTGFIGMAIAGIGVLLAWLPIAEVKQRIMNIAVGGVALLVLAVLAIGSQFDKLYGTQEIATYLRTAEEHGQALAHVGPYYGQFQFAGRLRSPLQVIAPDNARAWCASHPNGLIVTYTDGWQPRVTASKKPVFEASYRDQRVRIWDARTVVGGAS